MDEGYVKLYRSILESGVWADEWLLKLWIWCLLRANYADRQWKEIVIGRGQFVTGRDSAADALGVHPSRIYRGLAALERMGNITLKSNNKNTIVTVVNYESYQNAFEVDRTTNEQQTNNQRTTSEQPASTREEVKKVRSKEGKKNTPPNPQGGTEACPAQATPETGGKRVKPQTHPGFEEWFAVYPRHVAKVKALDSYRRAVTKIGIDELLELTKEYARAVIGHVPKDKIPYPATWLNQERWTDDPAEWMQATEPMRINGRHTGPAAAAVDPRGTFSAAQAWMASKQHGNGDSDDGE